MNVQTLSIASIEIGERIRHDYGDLDSLAQDIADIGLQQPIVVKAHPDYADTWLLVIGGRRLEAVTRLNWTQIPAVIATNLDDELAHRRAELSENTQRKQLSMVEALKEAMAQEELERIAAKERMLAGTTPYAGTRVGLAEDIVAHVLGMGRDKYRQGKRILLALYADEDNEVLQGFVERLDRVGENSTETIGGIYQDLERYQMPIIPVSDYEPELPLSPGEKAAQDFKALVADTNEKIKREREEGIVRYFEDKSVEVMLDGLSLLWQRFTALKHAPNDTEAQQAFSDMRAFARALPNKIDAAYRSANHEAYRLAGRMAEIEEQERVEAA